MGKRWAVAIFMVALALGVLPSAAAPGNGGGNGNGGAPLSEHPAKYGLCRAYSSGNGGENGRRNDAPPFAGLEQAAEEAYSGDEDDPIEDQVREFCDGTRPSNGQGRGHQDDSSAPNPVPPAEA